MRPELQEIITKRKKSYHHFTFELCEQWMTKFVLDLFRDGFPTCTGPFGGGMWKNWKVAALKYLCPSTSMPWKRTHRWPTCSMKNCSAFHCCSARRSMPLSPFPTSFLGTSAVPRVVSVDLEVQWLAIELNSLWGYKKTRCTLVFL